MIAEPRKHNSKLWPGMIFALIGLNFCVVALTVYASTRNANAHSVVPDYDRRALNWNQAVQELARNKELSWSIRIEEMGGEEIAVSLEDKESRAIEGADISVEAFHHAHAGNRLRSRLRESKGLYRGSLPIGEAGLWDLSFTVRHRNESFTVTQTRIVTEASP